MGLDAIRALGVPADGRLVLTGGGSASPAYRQLLADLSGRPVHVSDMVETSAAGAAVQAAAVLHGRPVDEVVQAWAPTLRIVAEPRPDQAADAVRSRYGRLAGMEALDD
jgi:xylulokinase